MHRHTNAPTEDDATSSSRNRFKRVYRILTWQAEDPPWSPARDRLGRTPPFLPADDRIRYLLIGVVLLVAVVGSLPH